MPWYVALPLIAVAMIPINILTTWLMNLLCRMLAGLGDDVACAVLVYETEEVLKGMQP